MKKFVKLTLSDRTTADLITLSNSVSTHMTGNAKFPTPPVTPAALKAATDVLVTLNVDAKLTRSIVTFAKERNQMVIVEDMLRQLGDYVDMVAKGDETVINDAGMPASKTRSKNPPPFEVTKLTAMFTGVTGTIQLAWKRPQYSKLFRVYMSTDPTNEGSWILLDTITTRKMMVKNLESKQRFYFRVVPVGTAGVGPVSEIAESIAA